MKRVFIPAIIVILCTISCAKSSDVPGKGKDKSSFEECVMDVTATIDPFISGESTKNTFDKTTKKWAWEAGDQLGFWSDPVTDGLYGEPAQVVFDVKINPGDTLFHGNGYGVMRDCTYNTYYPYNKNSTATSVPITYIGQNPLSNGGVSHLGRYDYLYSSEKTPKSDQVRFTYHHLGCVTDYKITVDESPWSKVTFTKLTITAPDLQTLVSEAEYNPSDPSSMEKTYASSIVYNLGEKIDDNYSGITVSQDEPLEIYTMMCPAAWKDKELTITLNDSDGHTYQGTKTPKYNQDASKNYLLNIQVSDVSSIKNLSSGGCANCYIVSAAGDYKFRTRRYGESIDISGISKAELYWESNGTTTSPGANSIIGSVNYSTSGGDGYIYFNKPSDAEGNALIVAKSSTNQILWSWHIWCTDKPGDEEYRCSAGTLMDRNLGALSKEGNTSTGLLYQWGRKDPFMGNASIASNTAMAVRCSTDVSFGSCARSTAGSTNQSVTSYAVQHPTTFIQGANNDWLPNGQSGDEGLWRSANGGKTINDPCPPGYKVSEGSRDNTSPEGRGFYGIAFNTNYEISWSTDHWSVSGTGYGSYNLTLSNNVMYVPLEDGSSAQYPVAGYLSESYVRNGNNILIWTNYHQSCNGASKENWTSVHSGCLDVNTTGHTLRVNWTSGRAAGKPVRCQKILTKASLPSSQANENLGSTPTPSSW